jgi:hypothetical protein
MGESRGGYSRSSVDAGSRYSERRSVPRYRAAGEAQLLEPLSNLRLAANLTEISLHGCYVSTAEPLPRHSVFQIRIERQGAAVDAWARVAYVQTGKGMGVSFLKIEAEAQQVLRAWLEELAAAGTD